MNEKRPNQMKLVSKDKLLVMTQIAILLLGVLATLFAGQSTASLFGFGGGGGPKTTSLLIDRRELGVNKPLVSSLCDTDSTSNSHNVVKQLSKFSSIQWLHKNLAELQNIPSLDDREKECLDKYREPLEELAAIVGLSEPDACSDQHISLVETFHRKYIESQLIKRSSGDKKKEQVATLPAPLKWFFLHYGLELSDLCQQNFMENLELMGKNTEAQYKTIFDGMSGKFIAAFRRLLKAPDRVSRHEDFVLIWSIIDRFGSDNNHHFKSIDPVTGDKIRLRLKIRDTAAIRVAQRNCRINLRPFYGETALSSMRLIDMGYNSVRKFSRVDISMDRQFQNWYGIAQACDFILALQIYEDPSLHLEEVVAISWQEATQMIDLFPALPEAPVEFKKLPALGFPEVIVQEDDDPKLLFKLVKSNVKSRVKNFKHVLYKALKAQTKSRLKRLFISRKSVKAGNKYIQVPQQASKDPVVKLESHSHESNYASKGDERDEPAQNKLGSATDPQGQTTAEGQEFLMSLEEAVGDASFRDYEMKEGEVKEGEQREVAKPQTLTQWFLESTKKHPFLWSFGVPTIILAFILIIIALNG